MLDQNDYESGNASPVVLEEQSGSNFDLSSFLHGKLTFESIFAFKRDLADSYVEISTMSAGLKAKYGLSDICASDAREVHTSADNQNPIEIEASGKNIVGEMYSEECKSVPATSEQPSAIAGPITQQDESWNYKPLQDTSTTSIEHDMVCNPLFDSSVTPTSEQVADDLDRCANPHSLPISPHASAPGSPFSPPPSSSQNDCSICLKESADVMDAPIEVSFSEEADETVYRKLLQLEAVEDQLARQQQHAEQPWKTGFDSDEENLSADISGIRISVSDPGASSVRNSDAAQMNLSPTNSEIQGLPWSLINHQLLKLGFPPLNPTNGGPDSVDVYAVIQSVLTDYDGQVKHVHQLTEAAQQTSRREELLVRQFQLEKRRKEDEVRKWKRLALQSQKGLRQAQHAERQLQCVAHKAATDCKQLEDRVQQLLHELRAKDAEADRMQQRFASHLDKEDRRNKADKAAYARLKRAFAASKGADTPKDAVAFTARAAKEMRPYDIVRIYEDEQANMQEEMAIIRAENRVLEGQLQQARESLSAAGKMSSVLQDKEDGQARAMARINGAAEGRATRLAQENAALQQELALRPTHDQLVSLQRQVDIMSRQLSALAAQKAGTAKDNRSTSKPRCRQLTTREAIQRDKHLARLGLYAVEDFPKPVLLQIVQDACLLLECKDALKLCDAIKPLQDTAALVPRLQRFVDETCWTVFQKGLAHVPEQWRQNNSSDVPAVLGCWIAELGELLELRGSQRKLLRLLHSRPSEKPDDPSPALKDIVPVVARLIEFEKAALHSKEVVAAAESVLVAQPDVLVNHIVKQFQNLFACNRLEGVLPYMNKLYLTHYEAQTFLKNLRAALGLDAGASLETVTNRVAQLLQHKGNLLSADVPNPSWQASDRTAGEAAQGRDRGVVVIERPRRSELQRGAEVAIDRMAARRKWPTVEIYVPPLGGPAAEQASGRCHHEEGV